MHVLRTPDECLAAVPDYPFDPHYVTVAHDGAQLRMHYVDEGSDAGETIVLVHGQPSWSFLYRHIIPPLVDAGHRVIAPDLIGFGKSDKPATPGDHTYERQVTWLRTALFERLELRDVTLFCHDWGGLLALRIVAHEPELFCRVMISNTGLPWGGDDAFFAPDSALRRAAASVGTAMWQRYARHSRTFPIGRFVQRALTTTHLTDDVVAAYDAPFPSGAYKAGPRAMPQLIPTRSDSPGTPENRQAWALLGSFDKPFRTAFSAKDPTVRFTPIDERIQRHIPGATGQAHRRIPDAGHFPQEDNADAVTADLLDFIDTNPRART